MFDNSMKGQPAACKVMTTKPSGANYKMMGEYKSQADAERRDQNDERMWLGLFCMSQEAAAAKRRLFLSGDSGLNPLSRLRSRQDSPASQERLWQGQ
jgi:hypothetical protein